MRSDAPVCDPNDGIERHARMIREKNNSEHRAEQAVAGFAPKSRPGRRRMEKKREETRKTEDSKLDINFGSQIRSYVLAPYRMIKDHRTKLAIGDVDRVLNGGLDPLIHAYLVFRKTGRIAGDGKDDLPE